MNYSLLIIFLTLMLSGCATSLKSNESCGSVEDEAKKNGLLFVKSGNYFQKSHELLKKLCSKSNINKSICTLMILDVNSVIPPMSNNYGVILTKGMLRKINNDDYLAMTIAHELAHIKLGHNDINNEKCTIDNLKILLSYPTTMSDHLTETDKFGENLDSFTHPGYVVGSLWLVGSGMFVKHAFEKPLYHAYDHEKEIDADLEGLKIYKNAGFKLSSVENFWDSFEIIFGKSHNGHRNTHPQYIERKKRILNHINSNLF